MSHRAIPNLLGPSCTRTMCDFSKHQLSSINSLKRPITNPDKYKPRSSNEMAPAIPVTTPALPRHGQKILTDAEFIAAAAHEVSRTLPVSHPSSSSTNPHLNRTTQHRPYVLRFTSHPRNLTMTLTLSPPGACSGWLSQQVLDECAEALGILRVVFFALLVILIFCLFSRVMLYVLS